MEGFPCRGQGGKPRKEGRKNGREKEKGGKQE
jgi:hypothetical protein